MRPGTIRDRIAGRVEPVCRSLFDEVSARLPLFDDLSSDALDRLSASGMGRGMLTASLRARLRKAGFTDMGRLSLATWEEVARVRKIGPTRIDGIRTHILAELSKSDPGARATHSADATSDRRLQRLRACPVEKLSLDENVLASLGDTDATCEVMASLNRDQCLRTLGIPKEAVDRIVVALVRLLTRERPPTLLTSISEQGRVMAEETNARELRARVLEQQDREWDEAAPVEIEPETNGFGLRRKKQE